MQPGQSPAGASQASAWIGVGNDSDLLVGGAFAFRVADPGFVPVINNSVFVEAVLFQSVAPNSDHTSLGGRLRWDFHLAKPWSVYAAPGILLSNAESRRGSFGGYFSHAWGGFFHINEKVSLRAETGFLNFGFLSGVLAGATFRF